MSLTFEEVSYSYANPKHEKLRRHSRRGASPAPKDEPSQGELLDATSLACGKVSWGAQASDRWALRSISFSLKDGEFLGVAGHTGSGKSTLVQHMNGLLHPTSGRVLVNGENLAKKSVARSFRGKVGVVFQYPEYQLFAATVYDDVAFGPRNMGLEKPEVDRRTKEALEQVQLSEELLSKSPFELSGGQQRRVAFAGILAMSPSTFVMDEPMAGLDPVAREDFLTLIESLHTKGLSMVMVSHNMDDLARLSDRILVLNKGSQFALGTPTQIFSKPKELRAIGLDLPAPQKLAEELRMEGFSLARPLYNANTLAQDIAAELDARPPSTSCELDGV